MIVPDKPALHVVMNPMMNNELQWMWNLTRKCVMCDDTALKYQPARIGRCLLRQHERGRGEVAYCVFSLSKGRSNWGTVMVMGTIHRRRNSRMKRGNSKIKDVLCFLFQPDITQLLEWWLSSTQVWHWIEAFYREYTYHKHRTHSASIYSSRRESHRQ